MKEIKDIYYTPDKSEAQMLDVYLPEGETRAVFLYMHGGGLDHGSRKRNSEAIAGYLTARGIAYVTIDYRMYPDAHFPDYIRDGAAAIAYVKSESVSLFGKELPIYVGGSSAGGYLSMMLCFDKRYLAEVGLESSAIAGYFHDAGQPTAHFRVLAERGIDSKRVIVDEYSPLYFIGTEESYPPMRFIVSDNDMKNRYEQTMLTLSTMDHFGIEGVDHVVMEGRHCAYVGRIDDDGESTFGKMIYSFIERCGEIK
ncbi:MAG: alpha/beta hydrolase [Clostridia bacterium]|nr:alpha/beta hydrolase [Clostridia bacterium]